MLAIRLYFYLTLTLGYAVSQSNDQWLLFLRSQLELTVKDQNSSQYQPSKDIKKAKLWLKNTIEAFFKNYDKNHGDFSEFCTVEYTAFKTDATNVDMGDGLSLDAYNAKWSTRVGPYAGINTGFMVSAQDFGTIKVASCEYVKKDDKGRLHFKIVIFDTDYKAEYLRTVVLLKTGKSFLIDDVLELSEKFEE
ncbi:MAG: hypothetical protein U0V54_11540 [Saprospiraceae bacterium]